TQLDRARGHPHLRLEVVTDRTVEFDRAHLRCRDGTEAAARILATVHHVPPSQLVWRGTSPPLVVDPGVPVPSSLPPEAEPQPVINGPSSLPGAGKIAELTLVAGTEPLSAVSLLYAPRGVATGEVLAAAGRPDSLPYWRRQAAGLQAPWVEH